MCPSSTHSDCHGGTGGGQRSLAGEDEVSLGGPQTIAVDNVGRREVVHLIVQDNSSTGHHLGTKVCVDGSGIKSWNLTLHLGRERGREGDDGGSSSNTILMI